MCLVKQCAPQTTHSSVDSDTVLRHQDNYQKKSGWQRRRRKKHKLGLHRKQNTHLITNSLLYISFIFFLHFFFFHFVFDYFYFCVFLHYLLNQRVYTNGLVPSHSISHLFQRLSITLWRDNACLWATSCLQRMVFCDSYNSN